MNYFENYMEKIFFNRLIKSTSSQFGIVDTQ